MPKIYVVGIGPGDLDNMTPRARAAIEQSDIIIGYNTYIDLLRAYYPDLKYRANGMRREAERCRDALDEAKRGNTVALVSGGDAGIYGMASLMLQIADGAGVEIEVIPGVTAGIAASAELGAPVSGDCAIISLSDLLTPWELIEKRLDAAAAADFVICIYNPRSKGRQTQIERAREMILRHRGADTVVGIARNIAREGQSTQITTLGDMLDCDIDMFTLIVVGNSQTRVVGGRMLTPRGYLEEMNG